MKSAARRFWCGRTSRSPRMSCSPMTARSAVSKPASRPRTASADHLRRQRRRLRPGRDRLEAGQAVVDQHLAHAVARALAPAGDDDALALPSPGHRYGAMTASKTLTSPAFRSAAKVRPLRPPMSMTPAASGWAKGEMRASGSAARRSVHSVAGQVERSRGGAACRGPSRPALPRPAPGRAPRSGRRSGRAARPTASSARWSRTTGASPT